MNEVNEVSDIEIELCGAAGLDLGTEVSLDRQEFLGNLARAVAESLDDDAWEQLTETAQKWTHQAVASMENRSTIMDFPNGETATVEDDGGDAIVKKSKAKKGKSAKAKKTTTKATKKANGEHKTDAFGVKVGTKAARAVEMLTEGCKMSDVKRETGINHYNLVKKLVEEMGHKKTVHKGVITLTHKDVV